MKLKARIIKKNFSTPKMPSGSFECEIRNNNPYCLTFDDKSFMLDAKVVNFMPESIVMEGIIANDKKVLGRVLIEYGKID